MFVTIYYKMQFYIQKIIKFDEILNHVMNMS